MNHLDPSGNADDILNSAEEIKIIVSCVKRFLHLKNVEYNVNRKVQNGVVLLGIEFFSRVPEQDIESLIKLLERDMFEHCLENNYQISVEQDKSDSFDTSCQSLLQHMRKQFGNCLSPNMNLIDVEIIPTAVGVLGKKLLGFSEYPLAMRIIATHPHNAYYLPEEEIESAQKNCMRHIEGLHNIAAKYVQRVKIITV